MTTLVPANTVIEPATPLKSMYGGPPIAAGSTGASPDASFAKTEVAIGQITAPISTIAASHRMRAPNRFFTFVCLACLCVTVPK